MRSLDFFLGQLLLRSYQLVLIDVKVITVISCRTKRLQGQSRELKWVFLSSSPVTIQLVEIYLGY